MAEKEITVLNHLDQLTILAESLESISEEWELSMSDSLNLNLVLEELITNTIFYGYDDKDEHKINIALTYSDKIIKVTIEDDGREFNPLLIPEADTSLSLEERKIGGLGIHFVRKIMDEVHYIRQDNKNILTLKKNIA